MNLIIVILKGIIGCIGPIITFFTIINFMQFLSDPNFNSSEISKTNGWITTSWSLFKNMALISLFVIQHSLMADIKIKNIFHSLHLTDIQRSVYVICTCLCLQVLIQNWCVIPDIYLWKLNINSTPIWLLYTLSHVFAWLIIYVGAICLDVTELLGVKQVYYSIRNLPNPNTYKSIELQRFYAHMRHPSFISFLILFWFLPVMTMDRILLGTIISLYMYLAWNPDELDYRYQETQYNRKYYKLNLVN